MELQGGAKRLFEEWYENNYKEYDCFQCMDWFEHVPSMQYGIYVDFFESNRIYLEIEFYNFDKYMGSVYMGSSGKEYGLYFETRPEARTAAITKACEILNNKLKQ